MTAGQPGPASFNAARPGPQAQRHPEHPEHAAWGTQGRWSGAQPAGPGAPGAARRPDVPDLHEPTPSGPFRAGPPTPEGIPGQRTAPGGPGPVRGGPVPPPPHPAEATGLGAGMPGQRTRFGPRQEFIDAFDAPQPAKVGPEGPAQQPPAEAEDGEDGDDGTAAETPQRPARGCTFTGAAAAAVVTVLAVVVAGQVADGGRTLGAGTTSDGDRTSRSQNRAAGTASPSASPAAALTYAQAMAAQYPLDPDLTLSDTFRTVPGTQKAPGKGEVLKVRVDVERGLPLNASLFAEAVFKTLNDSRSWGHGGTKTFERVSSGSADIVLTLASPGATAKECAKSGLDTTVDNVSCDSAATPRTMINAYRWAQGSKTYGASRILAYRQMLINHEVGHRLGYNHVLCPKNGALAPVMMQQTKFLTTDGRTCKPNPWPYPNG